MLKHRVTSDPVLWQPDHNCPFILEVDASQYATSAILWDWYQFRTVDPCTDMGECYFILSTSCAYSIIFRYLECQHNAPEASFLI